MKENKKGEKKQIKLKLDKLTEPMDIKQGGKRRKEKKEGFSAFLFAIFFYTSLFFLP